MRFLDSIFKRRAKIERLKMLAEIFRFSRPDDIAKTFEFGRIEALHQIWIYFVITFLGLIGAFASIFGVFVLPYIDKIVDSRIEREIDKRIDRFSKFYAFTQEVVPIMGYDFYRIKSVKGMLQIKNNPNIETLLHVKQLITQIKLLARLISETDHLEFLSLNITRKDSGVISDSDFSYQEPVHIHLMNKQIDIIETFDFLEVKIYMDTDQSKQPESLIMNLSDQMDFYIDSIDVIEIEVYINKLIFYKASINRNHLKKSNQVEYTHKINLRNIFTKEGSVRKYYKNLLNIEKIGHNN